MTSRAPLDDDVRAFIADVPDLEIDAAAGFDEVRRIVSTLGARLRGDVDPALADLPTLDELVDGVRVRWYGATPDAGRDVIAFLHGGGWVLGDIDSYDDDARILAAASGATVVSIDYRRAPEHPFPAALDDTVAAVRRAAALPHRSLAIVGDSAGGNLALGAAIAVRADRIVDAVLALYPVVAPDFSTASYRENGTGYLLTEDAMRAYWDTYAPDAGTRSDPRLALLAGDLRGMPPTVIVSADYDPLRDEARALAARLVEADVDVTYLPQPGLTHGFQQQVPRVPASTRALAASYSALRAATERGLARRI